MAIKLDRSILQQNKLSGVPLADPRAFTQASQAVVQLGNSMQDLGWVAATEAARQTALHNDNNLNEGLLKFDKAVAKTDFDVMEGVMQADGSRKRLDPNNVGVFVRKKLSDTQKQILKAIPVSRHSSFLKQTNTSILASIKVAAGIGNAQIKDRTLALNEQYRAGVLSQADKMTDEQFELATKKYTAMLANSVLGNATSEKQAVLDLNSFEKQREDGKLRTMSDTASSRAVMESALRASRHQSVEEKAILRSNTERNIKANRTARIAEATRIKKEQKDWLTERIKSHEQNIDNRLFDVNTKVPVTQMELRRLRRDGLISEAFFDKRSTRLNKGFLFDDRQTDPDQYKQVDDLVEAQLQNPDKQYITVSDINDNALLSNEARQILGSRLTSRRNVLTDRKTSKARTSVKDVLNVDALTRAGKSRKVKKKQLKLVEFDRRVKILKEDPELVAKEMIDEELAIQDPVHKISQIDTEELFSLLPGSIQVSVKASGGALIPNIAEMSRQALALKNSNDMSEDDFVEAMDVLEDLADRWTPELIEKFGGIKSFKTIQREKREKKIAEDKEQARIKLEKDTETKRVSDEEASAKNLSDVREVVKEYLERFLSPQQGN
jgi:hypothetical protein